MDFIKDRAQSHISRLDEKTVKKLGLKSIISLVDKVEEYHDQEVETLFNEMLASLDNTMNNEKPNYKIFKTNYSNLRKLVRAKYGFVRKGEYSGEYISFGIAIGVAFGAAFTAINPGMMGVGIAIGVAIGAGIGSQKDKEAEKNGKTY